MLSRHRRITDHTMIEKEYFRRDQIFRPNNASTRSIPCPSCHNQTRGVIVLSVCLLLFIPLLLYHLLTHHFEGETTRNEHNFESKFDELNQLISFRDLDDSDSLGRVRNPQTDLDERIEELTRIKGSVLEELKDLESRRLKVREETEAHQASLAKVKTEITKSMQELNALYSSIEQAKVELRELREKDRPYVELPLPIQHTLNTTQSVALKSKRNECGLGGCFDYSLCSVTAPFAVYLYEYNGINQYAQRQYHSVKKVLLESGQLTFDPNKACVFMLIYQQDMKMDSLQFWRGNGINHVIVKFNRTVANSASHSASFDKSAALLISDDFEEIGQNNFDIFVPKSDFEEAADLPFLLPAYRKYLLTFSGENNGTNFGKLGEVLDVMHATKTRDKFYFESDCAGKIDANYKGSCLLCSGTEKRADVLKHSIYVLVPYSGHTVDNRRVYEALLHGAIPVILYKDHSALQWLPFGSVLDWKLASVQLPYSRLTEMHFLLRSIGANELLEYKRVGRLFLYHYLNGFETIVKTAVALLTHTLKLPPHTANTTQGTPLFGSSWTAPNLMQLGTVAESDEYLGPVETAYRSPEFETNFTLTNQNSYRVWNQQFYTVFKRYPYLPWRDILPTEAQFHPGTSNGFRPIAGGQGGSGKEFSEAIGGNVHREMFTIVMLTYERENVLVTSIQRLHLLPYLHKVIVVWNSANPPSADVAWPKLHVPVVFIKPQKNSLNNRFLPYSHVNTEAVLSIDDDVHLTHAEIIFAFRVWRENRDRIVGFPGRFHGWDLSGESWRYNSNHSCQLSMVLTGAAFYHKYYSYIYSQEMPVRIRSMVDELMNCEDLAINFLVAHLTRKPPIKVTSKWTFRCAGCPETLSSDESHFEERHVCMRRLTTIYGYNPLINTQYRVDSVLFKTRLPHHHQKCFKFI